MTSPKPLAAIIAAYLVIIKLVLPSYMKDRSPYELRSLIKWYNVVQIIANAVVTWGVSPFYFYTNFSIFGISEVKSPLNTTEITYFIHHWHIFCLVDQTWSNSQFLTSIPSVITELSSKQTALLAIIFGQCV